MNPKDPNYPKPLSKAVVAVMKANKRANTKPELAIRALLHKKGLRFRKDFPIKLGNRRCRPDIVFTRIKLAIFIDGCFWHQCPEHGHKPMANVEYWERKLTGNVERDLADTTLLRANGWHVLRLWEHVPVQEAVDFIMEKVTVIRGTCS